MLHLFSARQELFRYGQEHYRPNSPDTSSLLLSLLKTYNEDPNMPDKMKEFLSQSIDELLASMPVEKRLKGLPAEELRKRLSTEERLEGLPVEERLKGLSKQELIKTLEALTQKPDVGDSSAMKPQ